MEEARCIGELLERCPAFRAHWDEHQAWWHGRAGLMLDLAVFGEYAARAIERAEAAELAAVAGAAEWLLGAEDEAVEHAAIVGFLASLMQRCHADPAHLRFDRLTGELGPKTLAACRRLDEALGTRTPGVWDSLSSA